MLSLTERTTHMTTTTNPRRMARRPEAATDAILPPTESPGTNSSPAAMKRTTKQDLVLELLRREGGAPLSAIVDATGWLPHTARAVLSGLRKKGHNVARSKVDGETRYAVAAVSVR